MEPLLYIVVTVTVTFVLWPTVYVAVALKKACMPILSVDLVIQTGLYVNGGGGVPPEPGTNEQK